MSRFFCVILLVYAFLIYFQRVKSNDVLLNRNLYPRSRRSHEPGHAPDDHLEKSPQNNLSPKSPHTVIENTKGQLNGPNAPDIPQDIKRNTTRQNDPINNGVDGLNDVENKHENISDDEDRGDGHEKVVDRPQRETSEQQAPRDPYSRNTVPDTNPIRPNDRQPQQAALPPRPIGRQPENPPQRPEMPDRTGNRPPRQPPRRPSVPLGRPDRQPPILNQRLQPKGPASENNRPPGRTPQNSRPENANHPQPPQRPQPPSSRQPNNSQRRMPKPRQPNMPTIPRESQNPPDPPKRRPQPAQRERPRPLPASRERPRPPENNRQNPRSDITVPKAKNHSIGSPVSKNGDVSESGGEQKRSPQRPRGQVDTRNTVCETVCNCQRAAAQCNAGNIRTIPQPFPQGLDTITIKNNPLDKIASNDFSRQEFSSVTILKLDQNKIRKIEGKAFTGMSGLRELSIKNNRLTTIADSAFSGLSNLQTLSLSSNNLKKLNVEAFSKKMNIRSIDLYGNQLETLPSEIFDTMTSLETLSLGGNPWDCDCKLLGLFVWQQSPNSQLQEPIAKCFKPKKHEGKNLNAFSTKDMQEICIDDKGDEEEKSVEEKIEENCSEHNSSNIVNICYISESIYTQPGKKVCIHCAATIDDEKIKQLTSNNGAEDNSEDLTIEWKIPDVPNGDNSTINNGTLCIEQIRAADTGEYTCIAKSGNHTDEKSIKLTVNDLPNKVAIGLAVFIAASILLATLLLVRWWSAELRALKR
ncbi:uncharacterized protein LOC144427315 [Styela clava]